MCFNQSHLNHNCASNTSVETELNRTAGLKVIAGRDIKSGEELTTTYVNPSHTVHQRQKSCVLIGVLFVLVLNVKTI